MTATRFSPEWFGRLATGPRTPSPGEPERLSRGGVIAMAAVSLLLFYVYGDRVLVGDMWQWADDGLYLRQAEAIVRWLHGGEQPWLGPYDWVVLGKAPMFPIWLAALQILHVPLQIAEFALLLTLPWLFRMAVRPVRHLAILPLAATAILLSGLPFLPHEQRLLRSVLQAALTSGCQIACLGLILRVRRRDTPLDPWAAANGLLFGLAYLNREESIWMLPMMFCSFAAVLGWSNQSWRQRVRAASCLVIMSGLPIALIAAMNYHAYGIFVTTNRRAPEFIRAHQVMTALDPATRERRVPIREATRLRAYALSPTFARMRGYLEGPASDDFARHPGHLIPNGRPLTAREFFVSNFQFVLQKAAFQAGAQSAPASEVMFKAIADELESAMARGQISSGRRGPSLVTPPLPGDVGLILGQTVVSLRKLYTLEGLTLPAEGVSTDSPEDRQRLENMTFTRVAPPGNLKHLDLPALRTPRRLAYGVINRLDMLMYAAGTGAVLILVAGTAVRRRRDLFPVDEALAGLVLIGALFTFSLAIAVFDVLGSPLLLWSPAPYNYMGNAPLSVLSAFGIVVLIGWLRPLPAHSVVNKTVTTEATTS